MVVTLLKTMNYNELWAMNCYSKQTQTNPILKVGWLNGIDSVELAEQRGLQTNLTDRSKAHFRNVTPTEINGCANAGLKRGIWHDICVSAERR